MAKGEAEEDVVTIGVLERCMVTDDRDEVVREKCLCGSRVVGAGGNAAAETDSMEGVGAVTEFEGVN